MMSGEVLPSSYSIVAGDSFSITETLKSGGFDV